MNNYETVFILTPVLSDAQMKEAVEKFTNLLKEQGAEIVNEENWGLRKLAYPWHLTAGILPLVWRRNRFLLRSHVFHNGT